ncbi:hypothetical protein IV203_028809 [Nitzschia inconspicua]|uniref:Uncharacterized protein n=1 Tax=Nitzschia inconspicua TaxID=303405 RepID=A0A9K3LPB6_9STRA|nr:hypothetical protein IV203_028809 [Nitzschia inconspicua]
MEPNNIQQTEPSHQTEEEALIQFQSRISAMISSFHYHIDRISQLLNVSAASSESVMTSSSHATHAIEIRQCCRNIQEIFSRHDELVHLWNGSYYHSSDGNESTSSQNDGTLQSRNDHQEILRRKDELFVFVDDLVHLACVEISWDDLPSSSTGADNSLYSLIIITVGIILPNITNVCPLSLDQTSKILKRVLFLMQDIIEEYSYVNGNTTIPKSIQDLKLLESMVNLVTGEVSIDHLQQIIHPSEALQVLKIPLELVCLLTPNTGTSSSLEVLPFRAEFLYSVRVLVDFLLQNLSGTIGREHENRSNSPSALKPSVREWIQQGSNNNRGETRLPVGDNGGASLQQSHGMTNYDDRTFENLCTLVTPDEMEGYGRTESEKSEVRGGGQVSTDYLLSLFDQYGASLVDQTLQLLQSPPIGAIGDVESPMEEEGIAAENSVEQAANTTKLGTEQIESAIQMAHMSADFLLYMDSEQGLASSSDLTSTLRSLWIGLSYFILNHMSGTEDEDGLKDIHIAATEILFRLTKSHVGARLATGTKEIIHNEDDICALATMIFRLMKGPGGAKWKEDGKEWVAFLLEKCGDQISLQKVLYMALFSLTACLEEHEEMNEDSGSTYFSLLGLVGLDAESSDDNETAGDDFEEDIWRWYMRHVCFPTT